MNGDPAAIPTYADLLRLDGRGFVVLGAGQGIGEQTAHALAQAGATVLCVDSDAHRAAEVATAVRGRACLADVTRPADLERVFATAHDTFGERLHGVVDVVGMPAGAGFGDADPAHWQRQFDLVVGHAWLALQHAAPLLRAVGGGSVVFIGSIAGLMARSGPLLAYGSAKAALHHLVRGAAQELGADGIRVNAVAPGLTRTPRLHAANPPSFWESQSRDIPLGRPAATSDIAAAVLFLSTPMAAHVTGQVLAVDGGATLGIQRPVAASGAKPHDGASPPTQ